MVIDTKATAMEQEIALLKQQNADLLAQVKLLMEQNKVLQQRLFGRKSETKLAIDSNQLNLFDEVEVESDKTLPEPTLERITYTRKKQKGKREVDFSGLPVETVVYELPESERVCPDCCKPLHLCGRNVIRRELIIIPAEYKVREHQGEVWSCRNCEQKSDGVPMTKTLPPAPVIKGSGIASPSLVAHIANQKYCLALPLYRQEQEFSRNHLTLSRQTMANWLIYVSEHWLRPIYHLLKTQLLTADVLHADETSVQVLKEEGKKPESKSYMWLYRTGCDTNRSIVLYEYQPNRKHENASAFLDGFSGYLHADGYGAYHHLPSGIVPVGCWAHVRRKFADILKSLPDYNKAGSIPMRGKDYCDALFELERGFTDLPFDERFAKRQKHSKPIMDEFFAWAAESCRSIFATPRSVTGKALAYALNERQYLENVLLDGRLELSNNRAERSIKPFVIGRKNWLFANSEKGAAASSVIYSIIETAKENHLKPYEYLKYIFETAPNINVDDSAQLETLLPCNVPDTCRCSVHVMMDAAVSSIHI